MQQNELVTAEATPLQDLVDYEDEFEDD